MPDVTPHPIPKRHCHTDHTAPGVRHCHGTRGAGTAAQATEDPGVGALSGESSGGTALGVRCTGPGSGPGLYQCGPGDWWRVRAVLGAAGRFGGDPSLGTDKAAR